MTQLPNPFQTIYAFIARGALAQHQPWWKSQLFVWEPVLFGTWDGVFTSCMINIFGVVLFLRTGWLVGNTGVLMGMFLVSFVILVALVTVLSGVGVGEHCGAGSGGVYSMISSVLGGQAGGTIGLLYVFGQSSRLQDGQTTQQQFSHPLGRLQDDWVGRTLGGERESGCCEPPACGKGVTGVTPAECWPLVLELELCGQPLLLCFLPIQALLTNIGGLLKLSLPYIY
ncbi:hypothetical protein MC885_004827 [Smutsia gigantea]|nr:hypothetical protein MC885_004827 [Smutsia gigantea]